MRVTSDGISGQKWPPTILPGGSLTFTLARPFQRRNTFTFTIQLHLQYRDIVWYFDCIWDSFGCLQQPYNLILWEY